MCDMFLILKGTYFTGYADDNTPFVVRDNIVDVIKALEEIGESLVNWFSNNEMKLNTDKCHLLLHINNCLSEKLIGITFHCKLKFNKYIKETVCSCYVKYAFQTESTLYSYLNVKELIARSRREI